MSVMNQKQAIIDLGSNTTRLVVFDHEPNQAYHLSDEIRERVRLAEGMGPGNLLRPAAVHRTAEAMLMFRSYSLENGLGEPLAVATSAVRDATNQRAFLGYI